MRVGVVTIGGLLVGSVEGAAVTTTLQALVSTRFLTVRKVS